MNRTFGAVGFAALAAGTLASGAAAFEFFDGRLEIHGFYEMQIRAIANDFDYSDDLDLTQWYHVLNLEIESELFPDGIGPFDYVAAYSRVEARFDCVWSRGCGMFRSVDTFGDRAEHLPKRYAGAERTGFDAGTINTGDTRPIHNISLQQLDFSFKDEPVGDPRQPAFIWHVPGVDTLFAVPGVDGVLGTPDDPAFYTFARFVDPNDEYRWATRRIKGAINGQDNQFLGPWHPKDRIVPLGALADRANPFNPLDFNPSSATFGSTALPFRPAPRVRASESSPTGDPAEPRGLFIPAQPVAELMRDGEFDVFDQNFSQRELQWNHGGSQQDEKELKELYVDLEMIDGRLWIRAGKQTIVWGKTELFRTTDQFNPQDLALASLPSLEESRIALWAVRAVYSVGTLGPIEDLRVELAMNLDDFEPVDLGRCGEPYTPNPACNKTLGLFAHGVAGFALAGERRPPAPWNSARGIESGVRVEFRTGPFSFAVTDFYGYDDFPYTEDIFHFERNVDPRTGRPRHLNSRLGCDPEGLFDGDRSGCLDAGDDVIANQSANQQRFAVICSSSVGFSSLDRSVCAQSVFNSQNQVANFAGIPISPADAFGAILAGSPLGSTVFDQLAGPLTVLGAGGSLPFPALVRLNVDPADGVSTVNSSFCKNSLVIFLVPAAAQPICLSEYLSNEQEALLGCGPFYGTNCDLQGLDLLNTEMSALIQSWVGFPGTEGDWDTTNRRVAQPGTRGFQGGAVCTRFERGKVFILPGCRGPGDPGYDPRRDGTITNLLHPFTGQQFKNELAALSWNVQAMLVALSGLGVPEAQKSIDEFKESAPLRANGCSLRKPQLCENIQALYAVAHTTRSITRAGGNDRFGRTDFDWHVGGVGVLRYQKRNVLGVSADFAEDRTKSTWSIESTWIDDVVDDDNNEFDGLTEVDYYNVTISVDRPTFVNFLNANRTLFINTQWFFQYVSGYRHSFPNNGPLNMLTTFTVQSGYFQDRLLPGVTFVYDWGSSSGGVLPEVTFRFTEAFSATMGMTIFYGRFEPRVRPIAPIGDPPYGALRHADDEFVENGLSVVRDRDEMYLRIRYTF